MNGHRFRSPRIDRVGRDQKDGRTRIVGELDFYAAILRPLA